MAAALGGAGLIAASRGDTGMPAAAPTEQTVEPAYGAGLFDVDPDQGSVSQDPNVAVTGDIAVFPEDWEF